MLSEITCYRNNTILYVGVRSWNHVKLVLHIFQVKFHTISTNMKEVFQWRSLGSGTHVMVLGVIVQTDSCSWQSSTLMVLRNNKFCCDASSAFNTASRILHSQIYRLLRTGREHKSIDVIELQLLLKWTSLY
jgi:hypothetical protein